MTKEEQLIMEYRADAHGMQSGVAMDIEQGSNSATPKHLRVGINAAMSDHGGLVRLLVDKGIITELEYLEAIADSMRREKKRYELMLTERMGTTVTLL